jgi:hypothetical protein
VIVCDSKRFVFVHVQKTGGVTISRLIKEQLPDDEVRRVGKRHLSLRRILAAEPELTDYWIFGFVRDPWDRMASWWSMIERSQRRLENRGLTPAELGEWRKNNSFWRHAMTYKDFDEFVLRGTEEMGRLRCPQIRYLRTGKRRADFIGRTENLTADIEKVMDRLGLSTEELGHYNKGGSSTNYRDFYTPATRDRIATLFAKDIKAFGYEF